MAPFFAPGYEFLNCESEHALPEPEIYAYALKGFKQLREEGKLDPHNNKLTIIDYSLSANERRMWVIDLDCGEILFNELVSHGRKSGQEFAQSFSNQEGSHKSSLGFYITGTIYEGKHKESLKLHGVERGINDKAFDRGIVIHGADYVSEDFIANNGRLGRSLGCPAVKQHITKDLINSIANGTCVFAYYPDQQYLRKSKYLR